MPACCATSARSAANSASKPTGFFGTLILGIVGAVVGGWIWNLLLNRPGATNIDPGSIFVAFVGSCVVIGFLRLFSGSRSAT